MLGSASKERTSTRTALGSSSSCVLGGGSGHSGTCNKVNGIASMNSYRPTAKRYIPALAFSTLVLGSLAYAAVRTGGSGQLVVGVGIGVILLLQYAFVVRYLCGFALKYENGRLEVRRVLGKRIELGRPENYVLVLDQYFIAFRREGDQDVTLDRMSFSSATWRRLASELRELPFRGCILSPTIVECEKSTRST